MILAALHLLAALTSAEAIAVILNTAESTSAKTYAEAREIVTRDAHAGKPLQQFVYGLKLKDDDPERAARYLADARIKIGALAENSNNSLAWFLLASDRDDLSLLRRAADLGNVQALNALGTIGIENAGQVQSSEKAENIRRQCFELFQKAAQRKDMNGIFNVASCQLNGIGCARDREAAFQGFLLAARAGQPRAMETLAECYRLGCGCTKDIEQSLRWQMRARVARGDSAAEKWLAEREKTDAEERK